MHLYRYTISKISLQLFMLKDPNLVKYSNKVVRSAQRLSLLEHVLFFCYRPSAVRHRNHK